MTDLALPNPGPRRYWKGSHLPNNVKAPLLLELREQTNSGAEIKDSFSRLIGKGATFADPKAIKETATEIMIRAARVDEFIGVLQHEEDAPS